MEPSCNSCNKSAFRIKWIGLLGAAVKYYFTLMYSEGGFLGVSRYNDAIVERYVKYNVEPVVDSCRR